MGTPADRHRVDDSQAHATGPVEPEVAPRRHRGWIPRRVRYSDPHAAALAFDPYNDRRTAVLHRVRDELTEDEEQRVHFLYVVPAGEGATRTSRFRGTRHYGRQQK